MNIDINILIRIYIVSYTLRVHEVKFNTEIDPLNEIY